MRVDMVETVAVVFMEAAGVEDGIEIDAIHTEFFQVVELVEDSLQVTAAAAVKDSVLVEVGAALAFPVGARIPIGGPWSQLPGLRDPVGVFKRLAVWVVAGVAVAESLRKKLVEDRIADPLRDSRLGGFGFQNGRSGGGSGLGECGRGQPAGQEQERNVLSKEWRDEHRR